ncbi:MAG TPA: ATP-binding protein [Thermoanaerobaculia bacterium]|nr:ATP-binding protein [Thermoanaerobaculia bacterium]
MSASPLPTRETIASEIRETLAEIRKQRQEAVDDRTLAWLALVPLWTAPLAQDCGFLRDHQPLQNFLDNAEASGLLVQQGFEASLSERVAELLQRNTDPQFWILEVERARVLADLADRRGASFLLSQVKEIASRLPPTTSVPSLDQWRELAALVADGGIGSAADRLRDHVRDLLKQGETGAVLGWLRTGSLLAQALGGQLESAVMRGRHEVEIAFRNAHDLRSLEGFLERQEQIRAFGELVKGPDSAWALHFLGTGGVGKTMLIRHVTAKLAAQHERITARVDFDYISPNYPLLRPEQLLVELADELRAYSAPEEFNRFEDRVRTLRDAMSRRSEEPAASDPLKTSEFQGVQRAFIDWLRKLPRKVVLILDTCEELAKLQPAGGMAPSIRATYQILEDVHDAVPSLRVVLAGRRPLALSGAGWHLRTEALPEGRRHLPPEKEYLSLHVVRGFTASEGDEYFSGQRVSPSRELRDAIFERSRESATVLDLFDDQAGGGEPRLNPFDLSLYVRWLKETPELSAELIRSGSTDPYVDLRIVRRLADGVRELLPAVAFLGRFDEAMLRPAAPLASDAAFADVYRELAEQEWIDYQHDLGATFLQVDRNLHPRLVAYYTANAEQRRLFDKARRQLGPALQRLVRERAATLQPRIESGKAGQPELGFDLVHAALRALDAEDAAELWEDVEARVAGAGRWDWAATMTGRLLGEEDAGSIGDELRPAIMATQASALLHSGQETAAAQAWADVLALAPQALPAWRARALEERAWLGNVAASPHPVLAEADSERLRQLWEELGKARGPGDLYGAEQTAAALLAATEKVLDNPESERTLRFFETPGVSALPGEQISRELRVFALILAGRFHRARGDAAKSGELLAEAMEISVVKDSAEPQRWAAWRAPGSLVDFVQLERLVHARWFDETKALPLTRTWPKAMSRLHLVESERLVSLHLELRLGAGVVKPHDLERLEKGDSYNGPRQPRRAEHRTVPPLFVNVALGWLALGDAERALALLDARIQAAKTAGPDPDTILHAEQAKLRVVSRMRLHRRGESLMERSLRAPELAPLGWPARALNGFAVPELPEDSGLPLSSELVHAWRRSRVAPEEHQKKATQASISALQRNDHAPIGAALAADLAEASWLAPGGEAFELHPDLDKAIDELRSHNAVACNELVRLECRAAALRQDQSVPDANRIGRRRLAEIALEEGEVLALRIPALALPILDQAYASFVAANDQAGALIAAICWASAALRSDRAKTVRFLHLTTKVQPSYESFAKSIATLPPWSELLRRANDPSADLSSLNHPSWGGWLHRLFRCLLALESEKADKQTTWLIQYYGENVPVELGFSPKQRELARKLLPGDEDRLINAVLRWSPLLLILGTVSALVPPLGCLSSTAALAFYLLLLFAGLGKSVSAVFTARRGLSVILSSGEASPGSDVTAVRPISMHVQETRLRLQTSAGNPIRVSTLTPGLREYREAAVDQPSVVIEFLEKTRRKLIGNCWWNRMAILIAVPPIEPPVVLSPPWEAILTMALPVPAAKTRWRRFLETGGRVMVPLIALFGFVASFWNMSADEAGFTVAIALALLGLALGVLGSWRSRGNELHFFRSGEIRWDETQRPRTWHSKWLQITCSRKWRLLAEQGWAPLAKKGFEVSAGLREGSLRPGEGKGHAVLHAMGRVLASTAGFQLEIGDDESFSDLDGAVGGKRFLGVEDLRGSNSVLVVVQGEPLNEVSERGPSERESAALLRAFAAELFAAGAEAVLVLPSLHAPLAEQVLQVLARKIADRKPPSLHRLLDAVADTRKIIRNWQLAGTPLAVSEHDKESFRYDQLEASLDVCLFARVPLVPVVARSSSPPA